MIKKNNKDVGFILKGTQNIDKIYHGTDLVFEQGFLREDEGTTPLTTSHEAIGKDLKDYVIYGSSVQNGTPTPDNPIEIQSVGDLVTDSSDTNYGKYKIPVIASDGINSITTNIYLREPLRKIGDYADYIDFKNSKVVRNLGYRVFTRTTTNTAYDSALSATLEFNLSNSVHFSPILSNRAVNGNIVADSNIGQARIYGGDFQVRVKYPDGITNANTKAEKRAAYNQWLSNNNIDLIYRLNTPTEETIELPDIPTFRGTTIFEVDTTVQPSGIKVIYKGK